MENNTESKRNTRQGKERGYKRSSGRKGERWKFKLTWGIAGGLHAVPQMKELGNNAQKGHGTAEDGGNSDVKEKRTGDYNDKNNEIRKCEHATREDLVDEEDENLEEREPMRNSLLWIDVTIGEELEVKAVVDTGATHSCIIKEMYNTLLERKYIMGELPVVKLKLTFVTGLNNVK